MLAGKLTPLEVERVGVAVVGGHSEDAHSPIVFEPAELPISGNVAPDEIATLAVPRRPLGPQRACPQALNRRVRLSERVERRIHGDAGWIDEIHVWRRVRAEVSWLRCEYARRLRGLRL